MRRFILATCVVGVCVWGCSRSGVEPVVDSDSPPVGTSYGDFVIGNPVSFENLTIFPISSKTPKNDDRFITLDEGLAAGTVKIIEIGAKQDDANAENAGSTDPLPTLPEPNFVIPQGRGTNNHNGNDIIAQTDQVQGDVNQLMVHNTSGKPLYLMPGEVISGGKQDRTIGQELVIAPSEKPLPIDVFCVEHGRWQGRSVESTAAHLALAADLVGNGSLVVSQNESVAQLVNESRRGKFVASVGQLNKDSRLAVQQSGDQSAVWASVATVNDYVGNTSGSSNFSDNYLSGNVAMKLEPFIDKLMPTGETKQIVGVAVAVNGKMLSVDVFESTPLFRKFWPKLLKSYALDAAAATGEKDLTEKDPAKKPQTIVVEDCIAFLKDVRKSKVETKEFANGQKIAKRQSTRTASFSYYDAKAAEAAGVEKEDQNAAGFGGCVHSCILAR